MKNMISVCRICSIQRWIVLLVVTLVLFSGIGLTAQEDPIEVISRFGFSNARAALQYAIISNNIELAQAAVAMGEDLNVIYEIPYGYYSKRYMTPLAAALEFGADITIIEALLHYGADPNDTILTNDLPALFIAGQRDMTNIVLLFYSAGADLRRTLPSGDTLMHVAAASNNLATVQLLHRIGLQLFSTNALGKTAVDIAPENTAVKKYLIQLRLREEYENKQAYIYGGLQTNVSEMLAENELKKGGWTRDSASFMRALTSLNERIVFCYIRTGFDPFASEKYKPIQSGSKRGADKLVRLLVQHAREQGKLDDISEQLEYSLFAAAASNNERIVTTILNVDIDVDTLNQEGKSPLLVALQCNAYDAVEALIKAGAATN
ncbi:MAG: ankyrin repeat domain-containing protein, partial [bacterium]|nr:ankyrin repeat domain-containing protein [bacterium]